MSIAGEVDCAVSQAYQTVPLHSCCHTAAGKAHKELTQTLRSQSGTGSTGLSTYMLAILQGHQHLWDSRPQGMAVTHLLCLQEWSYAISVCVVQVLHYSPAAHLHLQHNHPHTHTFAGSGCCIFHPAQGSHALGLILRTPTSTGPTMAVCCSILGSIGRSIPST